MWVQFLGQGLGQEDAMPEGMATHSSILAWRISQTEEPGRLQSIELHKVRDNMHAHMQSFQSPLSFIILFLPIGIYLKLFLTGA